MNGLFMSLYNDIDEWIALNRLDYFLCFVIPSPSPESQHFHDRLQLVNCTNLDVKDRRSYFFISAGVQVQMLRKAKRTQKKKFNEI